MKRDRKCSRVLVWVAALGLAWAAPTDPAGASPGAVDQGFGNGGVVQTDVSGLDIGVDVLVQPDGKAITIGFADDIGVLLRHRPDGTLDPTFGVGGVVRTAPGSFPAAGVLQPDGKIVVVGSNLELDDVLVFRYLPSGAPDPSFGTGGVVQTDFGFVDQGYGVALQPDGKVVVAGRSGDAFAVARYLPNGGPDPGFGAGGRTTTIFGTATSAEASSVGILSTGAIVVGGRAAQETTGSSFMLLARYTPGGTLDGTFGAGGRVAPADERLTYITSLVVQPGDRVVVGGASGDGTSQVQGLARYLANGSLDPTFGTAGSTRLPLGSLSTIGDLTVDAAGRLLSTGTVFYPGADLEPGPFSFVSVSRFSPDGVADVAFGCAGSTQVELAAAEGGTGAGIALGPDGRILIAGSAFMDQTTDLGRPNFLLVRILAEGPAGEGYWITRADGGLSPFGSAGGCGSLRGLLLNQPIVGQAARPSADGYWFVARDGGVFTRGDAPFLGSAGGIALYRPVVGMASTPSGNGYWLVASDGGIFAYGDAGFFGSTGGTALNEPVVGMAATPTGNGYWLVAADGGIFAFGDAGFFGSTGGIALNQPVVGMAATPTGNGYWLVARDGGVFAFGQAGFFGSTGGIPLNRPIVGMATTSSGGGYWLAGADGGTFAFGNAPFLGSTGSQPFSAPAVAIT